MRNVYKAAVIAFAPIVLICVDAAVLGGTGYLILRLGPESLPQSIFFGLVLALEFVFLCAATLSIGERIGDWLGRE
jgi:hypothetical protein